MKKALLSLFLALHAAGIMHAFGKGFDQDKNHDQQRDLTKQCPAHF
jgi:hypothetical protein